MKRIWVGVYIYGGIVNNMRAFENARSAGKWFNELVKENGGPDMCEPGNYAYNDEHMYFYDDDRYSRYATEIIVWRVPIE